MINENINRNTLRYLGHYFLNLWTMLNGIQPPRAESGSYLTSLNLESKHSEKKQVSSRSISYRVIIYSYCIYSVMNCLSRNVDLIMLHVVDLIAEGHPKRGCLFGRL